MHFWSHDGEWLRSVSLKATAGRVDASSYLTGRLAVSADGEHVVATVSDHSVCAYSWSEGTTKACEGVTNATHAHFVDNGKPTTVAVASDNTLVLVDCERAAVVKRIELGQEPMCGLTCLAADKYVLCAFAARLLAVDAETGQVLREFAREAAGRELVLLQMLLRNGSPWAMTYEEGTASVVVRSLLSAEDELALEGENTTCAAVSQDARLVAICTGAGSVEVWDIDAGGVVMQEETAHENAVAMCRFSADGRWLLTAGHDTFVKCWDVRAGFQQTGYERCESAVLSFGVTQGARGVVVGLRSGVVGHLSLVPAKDSPRAGVSFGESLLYNRVTTTERATRSNAKAKPKLKRPESPAPSSASSTAGTTARRAAGAASSAAAHAHDGTGHGGKCCTLL